MSLVDSAAGEQVLAASRWNAFCCLGPARKMLVAAGHTPLAAFETYWPSPVQVDFCVRAAGIVQDASVQKLPTVASGMGRQRGLPSAAMPTSQSVFWLSLRHPKNCLAPSSASRIRGAIGPVPRDLG